MLIRLLKLPISAFTTGRIYGIPITRNPIAWIPFFLVLPFAAVALITINIVGIALSPIMLAWCWVAFYLWKRKAGLFSDQGITFTKAYRRRTIPWTAIREVVRKREPKVMFYRIDCTSANGEEQQYIMSSTPDDEAFERAVIERGIAFRIEDWR